MSLVQSMMSKKSRWLWVIALTFSLLASYLSIVAVTSIIVSISHVSEPGFWVPLAFGIISLLVVILLYYSAVRLCLRLIKKIPDNQQH